ncbi:hypothetical protein KJZ63_03360 [Patescibacteria group bacterium]|nr:hypothetical protein [Patescibacteria group bacterium]
MFAIDRRRNGDLVLEIGFNPVASLIKFFTKLDFIFSQKVFYLLPMGLGIGFGLGIVIFSQPQISSAGVNATPSEIVPQELKVTSQNKNYFVGNQDKFTLIPTTWSNEIVYFPNWPNNQNQLLIASQDFDFSNLSLGSEIKILAKNQGQYTYHVYHFKELKSQQINSLKNDQDAKVILVKPTDFLGTNLQVLLAK